VGRGHGRREEVDGEKLTGRTCETDETKRASRGHGPPNSTNFFKNILILIINIYIKKVK
jgi:hypothetical protein